MKGIANFRKQNEDLGEPLPKRSKPAKYDASIRSPIYEERKYGNSCMKWPQCRNPQRERRFKPNKGTMKDNMMWPHKGIDGFGSGPPLNMSDMNDMQKTLSGDPPFMPQLACVGGFRVPPLNMLNMHPQMQMLTSVSTPSSFVQPGSMMSTSKPQTPELPPLNKIDIDKVYQNLVSSGILDSGGVIASNNIDTRVLPSAAASEEKVPQPIAIKPMDLDKRPHDKKAEEAPVPHSAPRNWTEWKALKLQLGQPSQH